MSIYLANTPMYNNFKCPNVKNSSQLKSSSSLSFKGSNLAEEDSFGYDYLLKNLDPVSFNIKRSRLTQEIKTRKRNRNYTAIDIGNKPFSCNKNSQGTYKGTYGNDIDFDFASKKNFFGKNIGFIGTINQQECKQKFNLDIYKKLSYDSEIFMTGTLGRKRIDIGGEEYENSGSYKVYIGSDEIDLQTKFTNKGTEVEGQIFTKGNQEGKQFEFLLNENNITGGTEGDIDYFPIIFALADRRKCPKVVEPIEMSAEDSERDFNAERLTW